MIKRVENYLHRKYNQFLLKKRLASFRKRRKVINSIAIVYYVPKTNVEKYNHWEDGFTKAVELLSKDFDVKWFNLEDVKPTAEELNKYDLILAKSCWNWIVDDYINSLEGINSLKGIAVSCSVAPKYKSDIWKFDIIWYETDEYINKISSHPNKFQAFGVNTDKFFPQNLEKTIDVLSVGMLEPYKRFEKLNDIEGNEKLIIGNKNSINSDSVLSKLDPSIKIIDYVSQEALAKYINSSKLVYIPASLHGGGERAVLEAKACGVKVLIEPDNQKLSNLLLSDKDFSINGYYQSLLNSIKSLYS
ncbi:hypothetical protein [Chryseobacterium sp. FH1]|uniref:hypothetical protein n=1 Tax=Chryseobacterium sp. FH1 TaxID=1233951 RepID=UPI0004E3F2EE|nr:hypothetical protein [Chryseobacterium sp. FH1]KFC24063.1 hypothetical protein IO90_01780 [Chryseobacterium sp. FH1]